MAQCPKCGYKLRIKDWRPECPSCGVNVVYYGIEDRLREEADIAEYHHAKSQPKFDRVKFSMIGHPLSIVRICISFLPVIALLLPMGNISYELPFGGVKTGLNLVSIITFLIDTGFDTDFILSSFGGEVLGKAFLLCGISLVAMVLIVVLCLVGLILLTLSCSPKGFVRNVTVAVIGMVFGVVGFVSQMLMIEELNAVIPGIFQGSGLPFAFIGVLVAFGAMIAVNVIYKNKDIQVKYKDVSELLLPYDQRPSTIAKKNAAVNEADTANA